MKMASYEAARGPGSIKGFGLACSVLELLFMVGRVDGNTLSSLTSPPKPTRNTKS